MYTTKMLWNREGITYEEQWNILQMYKTLNESLPEEKRYDSGADFVPHNGTIMSVTRRWKDRDHAQQWINLLETNYPNRFVSAEILDDED